MVIIIIFKIILLTRATIYNSFCLGYSPVKYVLIFNIIIMIIIIKIIIIITLEGIFNSMCTFVLIDGRTNQTMQKSMSWPSRKLVNFSSFLM